jgi:hypothetical protein
MGLTLISLPTPMKTVFVLLVFLFAGITLPPPAKETRIAAVNGKGPGLARNLKWTLE